MQLGCHSRTTTQAVHICRCYELTRRGPHILRYAPVAFVDVEIRSDFIQHCRLHLKDTSPRRLGIRADNMYDQPLLVLALQYASVPILDLLLD